MGQRACEREWTADKAQGVRELVERLTGKACPCDRGLPCPLLPDARTSSVLLGMPRTRMLLLPGLFAALDVARHLVELVPAPLAS